MPKMRSKVLSMIVLLGQVSVISARAQDGGTPSDTISSLLELLATRQRALTSFRGELETTRMNLPSTHDMVFYQVNGDFMCLDQLQGLPEEAVKAQRVIPVSLHFDGDSYWDREGALVIHSRPGRNPLAGDLFIRLDSLKTADLSVAQTNTPDGVCVFERPVSNPSLENNRETTLENPSLIAQMAKNGVGVDQLRANLEKARKMLPQGRERLWIRTDNGFCFLREQFDEHAQIVRKVEYKKLKFNIPFAPQLFQPNTNGEQVVESVWPYGQDVVSMIAKERENIRLPSTSKVVVQSRGNAARAADFVLKTYGDLWLKHDLSSLSGLRGLATAHTVSIGPIPPLLATAIYLSLVENDQALSKEVLERVDQALGPQPPTSYTRFKEALITAVKEIPPEQPKDKRVQELLERYKDGFPLAGYIKDVGQELQAVEDREPPKTFVITTEPVYFACLNNEMLYIDKHELDRKTFDAMRSMPSGLTPEEADVVFQDKGVSNDTFSVVPQTLRSGKLQLRPRAGVHGDSAQDLDRPDSKFQQVLQKLDREGNPIAFLVREDSVKVFERARALAEAVGFNTTSMRFSEDQLITLQLGAARPLDSLGSN